MSINPAKILEKPYHWVFVPQSDGPSICYIDEFPGCIVFVDECIEECWDQLWDRAEKWIEECYKLGMVIPEPYNTSVRVYKTSKPKRRRSKV
jgi:hypothetical protein